MFLVKLFLVYTATIYIKKKIEERKRKKRGKKRKKKKKKRKKKKKKRVEGRNVLLVNVGNQI